jgi:hypothetical protein
MKQRNPQQMSDDTLKALIKIELEKAVSYVESEAVADRRKALKYYRGDAFGNEVAGRSSVVSRDVADTIESILPSLIKTFTASDDAVVFDPVGEEDIEAAKQKTDYANYVFYKQNNGFMLLYNMFKDALLQKTGLLKIWWEETEEHPVETYEGLTEDQLIELSEKNEGYEVLEMSQEPAFDGQILTSLKIKCLSKKAGKVTIECVPPEEFIISPEARDVDSAILSGHQRPRMASDLINNGFDKAIIDTIPAYSGETITEERLNRNWGAAYDSSILDLSTRQILVTECYMRVDYDGDGIAELRKITVAGDEVNEILDNEEIDYNPICDICPIPEPHRVIGRSVADLTMDIQLIKSTILRQSLDNLYNTNNQRLAVDVNQIYLDDLLTSRPGGIVRTKGAPGGAVMPLPVQSIGANSMPFLEYMDTIREARTGTTRYNQGMDANSLNKTASGINAIMGAANQRLELIARIFAETGVKKAFKTIVALASKHQTYQTVMRLRNKFVPVDPREWKTGADMTINVGLGTGNKDQQMAYVSQILAAQKEVIASGGMGQLVSPENIYNALAKMVEAAGYKTPEQFFTDPKNAPPPPEAPPSPEMMKVQADMQMNQSKLEFEQQKAQVDIQTEQQKNQSQMQLEQQKMANQAQLDRLKVESDIALQREKMMGELQIKQEVAMMQVALQAQGQAQQAETAENESAEKEMQDGETRQLVDALRNTVMALQGQLSAKKSINLRRDASGNLLGGEITAG